MGKTTTTVVVTMGSEMMTGETLGYSTERRRVAGEGTLHVVDRDIDGGVGASNTTMVVVPTPSASFDSGSRIAFLTTQGRG